MQIYSLDAAFLHVWGLMKSCKCCQGDLIGILVAGQRVEEVAEGPHVVVGSAVGGDCCRIDLGELPKSIA